MYKCIFVWLFASITFAADDYQTAYKEAQRNSKPLVVLISAEWCPGCVKVKHEIFPLLRHKRSYNYAIVNADTDQELIYKLTDNRKLPQVIIYDKQRVGGVLSWRKRQLVSPITVESLESAIPNK